MTSETPIAGYCRICGKPLDEANVRTAHGTIFCEDHFPQEQAAQSAAKEQTPMDQTGASSSPYTGSPYSTATPPPVPDMGVSPGLAFLLGLIPGVGAIYNGQYAKGLAHVVIIGMLISILDNNSAGGLEPLLGLILAGFWAYMPFEAYHTAMRRRQGKPVDEFSSIVPMHGSSRFPVAPVVLIGMGVIFLLNNLEILELRRVFRFWPVLMIALGAYMLYGRMTARTGDRP